MLCILCGVFQVTFLSGTPRLQGASQVSFSGQFFFKDIVEMAATRLKHFTGKKWSCT
jgi:hypothetical protein